MELSTRLFRKLRALWVLARNERASPSQIGWAVGVGCFVGCSPAVGFHGAVALGAATLFRLNRMFCWLGSRSSNIFVLPFLIYGEIELGHRARTGTWLALDRHEIFRQASGLVFDWLLGMIPIALPASILLGLFAYAMARLRTRRPAARTPSTPPEDKPHKQGPDVQLQ